MPEWDVAESPFYDRVNRCLWFEHTGIGKMLRFDGQEWSFVPLPSEKRLSGDALAGFEMFNSLNNVYAYSPQGIWQWDQKAGWRRQVINGLNCSGERPGERKECFIMAAAKGDDIVTVIRHNASLSPALLPEIATKSEYDQICLLSDGVCTDVPNSHQKSFFVKEIVGGSSKAYILTSRNELFEVGEQGLDELPSPGNIDKVLLTDSQTLVAALTNGEILEFAGGNWKSRTDKPLFPENLKKTAYISAHGDKLAYAISGYDLSVDGDCSIRGQSAVWVVEAGQAQCVGL